MKDVGRVAVHVKLSPDDDRRIVGFKYEVLDAMVRVNLAWFAGAVRLPKMEEWKVRLNADDRDFEDAQTLFRNRAGSIETIVAARLADLRRRHQRPMRAVYVWRKFGPTRHFDLRLVDAEVVADFISAPEDPWIAHLRASSTPKETP